MTLARLTIALLLGALSGAAWGTHETISHHWAAFQALHPNANPNFWNPAVSWETTKTVLGYKFDAKHLLASLAQVACIGGGAMVGYGVESWRGRGLLFGCFALGYIVSNLIAFK